VLRTGLGPIRSGFRTERLRQAVKSRSTAEAIRNSLRSCPFRATSMSPTGNPPARGIGSEIAHRSRKFTRLVLPASREDLAAKPSGVVLSESKGATIFVVGMIRASNCWVTRSIAATSLARARWVLIKSAEDIALPRSSDARTLGSMACGLRPRRSS
jgi:hypothetical protein